MEPEGGLRPATDAGSSAPRPFGDVAIGPVQPATLTAKPRRGDAVRARILTAALECFGTSGFVGTSTRAIADRAKVTHTLALYHFQSKDALWIAMMTAALHDYAEVLKASVAAAPALGAKEALSDFIEQFMRMSVRQPQIHRILTTEGNQDTPRLVWIIDHFIRWHFTIVRDLVRRGQAEGSVRICDPARLYYLIIGAGGTPFTLSAEYKAMTGRDVFSEAEVRRNISFVHQIVFI